MKRIRTFAILACALVLTVPARAQDAFFRGKTIEIVVGTGAGGGYDANARLLARHLGRQIPGAPNVVVNNMPGGGGIVATNWLYNVAPRDGLALGTFSNAMLTEPLFGASSVKFDSTRFGWLGSLAREDGVCIASRASGVAAWAELRTRQATVGTTAPGTTTYLFPLLLRQFLGANLKFVSGYADGSQVALALERGEVDMICQTISSLRIARPDWMASGFVRPLVVMGLDANAELRGVPAIVDLVDGADEKRLLEIILAPTAAGRPFAAPPGISPERLATLRRAFDATLRDEALLDDARKTRVELAPLDGGGVETLTRRIYAAPAEIRERARAIVAAAEAR